MKNHISIIFGGSLLALSTIANAGGEDIYPEGFVEDCSVAYATSTYPSKRFILLDQTERKIQQDAPKYNPVCDCLSTLFFERSHSDIVYDYVNTINAVQGKAVDSKLMIQVQKDKKACTAFVERTKNETPMDKKIREAGLESEVYELAQLFLADATSSKVFDRMQGKFDTLPKCYAQHIYTYKSEEMRLEISSRVARNIRNGEPLKNGGADPDVEREVTKLDKACWK